MKRLYLFLLLFLVYVNYAYSQANAGPDKTVSQGHRITKIGTAGDPKWCYHWEAHPSDPRFTHIDIPQPEVSPDKTTTYKLTVTGPDFSFISSDEVTVFKFEIEYFRQSAGKEWKIVAGEPIEFSAIASANCTDWDWDMEDGVPDAWNPTGGNMQKGSSMVIPYSDVERASNSWFGDKYGTVTVSCKDAEGNTHTFSSTDLSPSKKAFVFFDPDKNVEGGMPSASKPPAWFVFWKDGKVVEDMDICSYDHNPSLYGYWNPIDKKMYLCPLAPTSNSGPETLTDLNGTAFTMTGTGKHLDCVAETIAHELHHGYIWNTWGGWGPIRPGHADTDGLPDTEEDTPSKTFFPKSLPGNPDTFGYPYNAGPYVISDNEVRCRIIEINEKKQTHPEKDWSKSPQNPIW